jgi:coupling of ubiquitin conjugation to ER degradation protein 1
MSNYAIGNESPQERDAARALGFRPKKVTDEMVNIVQTMFPDIPQCVTFK